MTNHSGKCNRDEDKGCIAQVNIHCCSKSCWYNCERQSPSVALVAREVNKIISTESWLNPKKKIFKVDENLGHKEMV